MRHRKTREPETIFPVTAEDLSERRHREDPADRPSHDDLERMLGTHDATPDRTLDIRVNRKS